MNNKNTQNRNKPIQVYFTEAEKNEIGVIAGEFNMSVSEFVRQSVFDKIRHHKNPKTFNSTTPQDTSKLLEQMNLLMKKQELMSQKLKIVDQMEATLNSINENSLKGEFATQTEIILNLLKGNKFMTRQQIIDATNLNEDIVFQITSNQKLFKTNVTTGKVTLR